MPMSLEFKTDNCQLCGSNNYILLQTTTYKNNPETKHYICNNCGFISVLPRAEIKKISQEASLPDDESFNKS
jgi:Fe2+ or Zn2+ uptake regulation protein